MGLNWDFNCHEWRGRSKDKNPLRVIEGDLIIIYFDNYIINLRLVFREDAHNRYDLSTL
jgi:hypothetical protein